MAVEFEKRWAKEHKASKIQVVREEGECFGVQWEIGDGRRGFFLFFHLDAAEESTRTTNWKKWASGCGTM